ncbi:HesA/MoeB/ThiF family protein [Neokomagataea thailandica]|uniref:Molybdopterin biosynthesis protein MoeB n=1 Tax=Neokomagataea tanensis NBRC 106556 TaxID=1223519 RepID=A0ABQ0QJW5_9PROT|nr:MULTISPECIES: HesA/MoeB/ThiF family protein [Neokomagataea]GBR47452.1 molybdopterin biosynthesis protein MoeB [Neokomagataea tanensis NBRC 106556]
MLNFTDVELERYARHILVPEIGAIGQARCRDASVLIIGIGGLGAPLAQQLAASGIGRIGLIDDDHIDRSNLQRQILYDTPSIGALKTDIAREKLTALNPHIRIETYAERATTSLLAKLLPSYDLVCDGTDNFRTRFNVSDACTHYGKTLISGAVQGLGGQVATFRPQHHGPCYRCLFPDADENETLNCSRAGVLGPATSVIGSLMAVETLKEVMQLTPQTPEHTIVTSWDALKSTFRRFELTRNPDCTAHSSSNEVVLT